MAENDKGHDQGQSQKQKPGGPPRIEIKMDDAEFAGRYANLAMINHSPTEFIVDMVFLTPGQPRGKVVSRTVLAPATAKRLLAALSDNVSRFEARFGTIQTPQGHKGEHVVH